MSLDVSLLETREVEIFDRNITHNLNKMAQQHPGLYEVVWRPEEVGIRVASDLIPYLRSGIKDMEDNPDKFKAFNPENGWGSYESLLRFLRDYLTACVENPTAKVKADR